VHTNIIGYFIFFGFTYVFEYFTLF